MNQDGDSVCQISYTFFQNQKYIRNTYNRQHIMTYSSDQTIEINTVCFWL